MNSVQPGKNMWVCYLKEIRFNGLKGSCPESKWENQGRKGDENNQESCLKKTNFTHNSISKGK